VIASTWQFKKIQVTTQQAQKPKEKNARENSGEILLPSCFPLERKKWVFQSGGAGCGI
jgi:hypothetical protein